MSAMTERINALTLDVLRQERRWDRTYQIMLNGVLSVDVALTNEAVGARLKELRYELRALVHRRSL